mgnify:CR=1 FL=1
MNQNSKKTLIEVYANAWKTLNVDLLVPFLDDKFTYSSIWILGTINRDKYIDYLRGKFNIIKKSNSRITAVVGHNEIGELAVVLRQDLPHIEDDFHRGVITIKEENGKITNAYMSQF